MRSNDFCYLVLRPTRGQHHPSRRQFQLRWDSPLRQSVIGELSDLSFNILIQPLNVDALADLFMHSSHCTHVTHMSR